MTTIVIPVSLVEDPGGPYLLFDLYPFDLGPLPDFTVPARSDADGDGDADFVGGILKATQGTAYGYTAWFVDNFKRLRVAGGDRYGSSWFRGAYHYLEFTQDPIKQADFYLSVIDKAGGWDDGCIVPIVDVEFGGERSANRRATTAQIIDSTTAFADRCRAVTGRRVMLYGRGAMRDRSIRSKMGCDLVWNAAYTATMVTNGLVGELPDGHEAPWTIDDIALWQYSGDGTGDARKHKLPLTITGFGHGKVDVSAFIDGARKPTLARLRERLL